MRNVRLRAEHVASLGEEYESFALKLRALAERFESKAVLAFVEKYMSVERGRV